MNIYVKIILQFSFEFLYLPSIFPPSEHIPIAVWRRYDYLIKE
jgi:hypothetical protein